MGEWRRTLESLDGLKRGPETLGDHLSEGIAMTSFDSVYKGRRVLVTGHTGFKGSWLSTWLLELGATVAGYSLSPPSEPSNFEVSGLKDKIKHYHGDIGDLNRVRDVLEDFSPEIVFHLAAQAITRLSYDLPQESFLTNFGGTVNILESIRRSESVRAGVIITSDKCYRNDEWVWGYRENDRLGGDDPYSASKACAEIACHSYIKSFFSDPSSPGISTARAGNVIGGGDWAVDRIVPDCVRAYSGKQPLELRSPHATRPWQFVLEPLSGYLWLGSRLLQEDREVNGQAFNFGPSSDVSRSVEELIRAMTSIWGDGKWNIAEDAATAKKESTLLKLNCDKALHYLDWRAVLSFEETVDMTASWYKAFYEAQEDMYGLGRKQIREYTTLARDKGLKWAGESRK